MLLLNTFASLYRFAETKANALLVQTKFVMKSHLSVQRCLRGGVIIKKQENNVPNRGGDQKKNKNVSNSNSDI